MEEEEEDDEDGEEAEVVRRVSRMKHEPYLFLRINFDRVFLQTAHTATHARLFPLSSNRKIIECLRLGRRVGDRQNCKLVVGIDFAYIWDK